MTNGQGVNEVPQAAAPQKKKSGALKWILIGGCGCLLVAAIILGLIGGLAYFGINKYKQTIEPTLNGHAQAILNGDIDGAYAYCSDEFKAITDRQAYEVFVQSYKPILTAQNHSFTNFNLNNNLLTVRGSVTTADGQFYPVTYQLIKKGDQWLIYSINIGN